MLVIGALLRGYMLPEKRDFVLLTAIIPTSRIVPGTFSFAAST